MACAPKPPCSTPAPCLARQGTRTRHAPMASQQHRALVTDLYKRFLLVGRDYPLGLPYVRAKAKAAILQNAGLRDEEAILRAVAKGRWWVKELIGVVQLKKYRTLRQRYDSSSAARSVEEAAQAVERRFDQGV